MVHVAALQVSTKELAEALRRVPVFADFDEDEMAWFCARCSQVRLEPGEAYIVEGAPANEMLVILEGEIVSRREHSGGVDQPVYSASAPTVTGALPFSRLLSYPRTGRAAVGTWLATFPKGLLSDLITRIPRLTERLVNVMSDRIRDVTLADGQHEKLVALGKLSAGFAHELNNPASVVGRAADQLRESLHALLDANVRLDDRPLSVDQRRYLACAERETVASLQSRPVLDSLGRSDRETFIAAWLEERGVRVAWKLAPLLVDMEWTDADLEDLGARFDQGDLPCVFARLTATISVGQLLTQLDDATKRISKLVDTLKSYSHMDRAPESEVDLHEGLDSTLDMFHSRFSGLISVVKTYDESIPPMVVHGGALNQVWTSLFDNALDAMPDGGALRIRTTRERDCALIEVIDSGVGIPDNLRARVFEPFFTTKPFGKAMGLGLDTAFRIVRRHHGHITFVSRPGETRFQVRLPFRRQYGM